MTELFDYLRVADQQLRLLDGEARKGFLRTVVSEIKSRELDCVTQQRCSHIVEHVLNYVTEVATFKQLFSALVGNAGGTSGKSGEAGEEVDENKQVKGLRVFRLLAENQYSSHVLQTLFRVAVEKRFVLDKKVCTELEALVEALCEDDDAFLSLCQDRSGSHVVRGLLLLIAGFLAPSKTGSKKPAGGKGLTHDASFLPSRRLRFAASDAAGETIDFVAAGEDADAEKTGGRDEDSNDAAAENKEEFTTESLDQPPLITQHHRYHEMFRRLLGAFLKQISTAKGAGLVHDQNVGPVVMLFVAIAADACKVNASTAKPFHSWAVGGQEEGNKLYTALRTQLQDLCRSVSGDEELLQSPVGSRVLEAVFLAHHAGVRVVHTFVTSVLLKSERRRCLWVKRVTEVGVSTSPVRRLGDIVSDGKYAAHVIQKLLDVLGANKKDAGLLQQLLEITDFEQLIGGTNTTARQQMVAAKFLTACARVGAHCKTAAGKFFDSCKAISERASSAADDLGVEAKATASSAMSSSSGKKSAKAMKKANDEKPSRTTTSAWLQVLYLGTESSAIGSSGEDAASAADDSLNYEPPAAGTMSLTALMSFPDKCVPFLVGDKAIKELLAASSATTSSAPNGPSLLFRLARTVPRVVEEMLKKPLLSPQAKKKLIGSLFRTTASGGENGLAKLALQGWTGWVVTAVWKAADTKQREEIADLLVKYERELRDQNIAVWKGCELHAWKTRNVEWRAKHEKADKKKSVFAEILEHEVKLKSTGRGCRGGRGSMKKRRRGAEAEDGDDSQMAACREASGSANGAQPAMKKQKRGHAQVLEDQDPSEGTARLTNVGLTNRSEETENRQAVVQLSSKAKAPEPDASLAAVLSFLQPAHNKGKGPTKMKK